MKVLGLFAVVVLMAGAAPIADAASPLEQFRSGTLPYLIQCSEGKVLMVKSSNAHPVCINPQSVQTLIEREWAGYPPEPLPLQLAEANNEFAIKYYLEAARDGGNVFFSPWSLFNAFAIVYEGADGDTARQMEYVFGFSDQTKHQFADSAQSLNSDDDAYKMTTANALWMQDGFVPKQEFVDVSAKYYDSGINVVDFSSGPSAINAWVSEKTDGTIDRIIEDISPQTQMIITNAIYFLGAWETPFDPRWTSDEEFYTLENSTVTVPMMSRMDSMRVSYIDGAGMLEMPYKTDKISMLVLLPTQIDGIAELEKSLSVSKIIEWKDGLKSDRVQVTMPKFSLDTEYDLGFTLKKWNLDLFESPDFTKISDQELWLNNVLHKAHINVDEFGTEASAVSAVEANISIPTFFTMDHPFIIVIMDNTSDAILFIGKVSNPAA